MKVLAYRTDGGSRRAGLLIEDLVVDAHAPALLAPLGLDAHEGADSTLERLLSLTGAAREAAGQAARDVVESGDGRHVTTLTTARLHAPYVHGRKILCQAVNYPAHGEETAIRPPDRPFMFLRPPTSVTGPYEPIAAHRWSVEVDYEVELAIVIGTSGRNISAESAYDHIAGFTILNDVSYRDLQNNRDAPGINDRFGRNWTHGKGLDASCPIGPWVTCTDELPDPYPLAVRSYVNGELRQDGSTQEQLFKLPELVAYASRGMTLQTGDLISTGTPSGVGAADGRYLRPNDLVTCEIEQLGRLENYVRLE